MKKIFLIILVIFLISGCEKIDSIKINDVDLKVEIVDSARERTKGLMYREELEGGMLFIFEQESEQIFWMKHT